MKVIENFLVLARFSVLMGLLIISRFVSPHLTDGALSEQEYTDDDPATAAEDLLEGHEMSVAYATARDVRGAYADGFDPENSDLRRTAFHQNVHRAPRFGPGYLRHRAHP